MNCEVNEKEHENAQGLTKPAVSLESFVFLGVFLVFFIGIGNVMGAANMLNTMMNTAFDLLINTVFYIMAIAVLAGAAYEGIGLLPFLGEKIDFILKPLFGFTSPKGIAVPITSLGAAGAAIGLVPSLIQAGEATAHDVAVFTAMCMCWSGYLSTHVAMMDGLKYREATGKAILSHTIGGLCAGVAANWIYHFISIL